MWIIDTEAAPPRLRGMLARWAIEVRAGLYAASTTAKVRDLVWKEVLRELGPDANAVMVLAAPTTPVGFEVRTAGKNRRVALDVDGVTLMAFVAPVTTEPLHEPVDEGPEDGYLEDP